MLFKLLRYDFRAMWKSFSLIWGAALALSLVHRFLYTVRPIETEGQGGIIEEIVNGALFFVMMLMFAIVAIFILQRFEKGLLGDEGYLMHTLPVWPWQLVMSKLICALAVTVLSVAVSLLALILMIPVDWYAILDLPFWKDILQGILSHPDTLAYLTEFCLILLSLLVLGISTLYLSISIGHLFHRWRVLMSVAAFIGLYILIGLYAARAADSFPFRWEGHAGLLAAAAVMLLPAVVFLAAVCWILGHRLNLE